MSTSHDSHSDPTQYDGLGHHIASLQTYIAVFGSLLFFTALTYAVSFADLGSFALMIAMMVAGVKAFLVATFFMHLKYDEKFNVLVFLSSVFFIAVFFGFCLMDLGSRAVITETEDYHTWWAENPDARPIGFGPAPVVEVPAAADTAHAAPAADGSHAAHMLTALPQRRLTRLMLPTPRLPKLQRPFPALWSPTLPSLLQSQRPRAPRLSLPQQLQLKHPRRTPLSVTNASLPLLWPPRGPFFVFAQESPRRSCSTVLSVSAGRSTVSGVVSGATSPQRRP